MMFRPGFPLCLKHDCLAFQMLEQIQILFGPPEAMFLLFDAKIVQVSTILKTMRCNIPGINKDIHG